MTTPELSHRSAKRTAGAESGTRVWMVAAGLAAAVALACLSVISSSLASPAATESVPTTLATARAIRSDLNARLRLVPGRKLAVTEASSTAIVGSLTLVASAELRLVPAADGIYFATCSARGKCPYPHPSASWLATSFAPRRLALELALRTFLETPASLVVVLLPTVEPVWVVFESRDLLRSVDDAPALLTRLTRRADATDTSLRELVGQLVKPRLYVPVFSLPPSADTIFAVSLGQD